MTLELDHAVINVIYEMDRAAPAFEALGFSLTPRGFHSMGSMNHLMMFAKDYLELIGLPRGLESPRLDIVESPVGINGLVFKSADVDETFARLEALDMAGDPPKAFNRPVSLPEGEFPAQFRTVAVRPGTFPAGRVYYCEHGTPELVWRPEWQDHANKVHRMAEMVVVCDAAEEEAERYGRLVDAAPAGGSGQYVVALANAQLTILSPAAYGARYGDLATGLDGRASIFGAIVFETADLDAAAGCLGGDGLTVEAKGASLHVRVDAFNSLLEFRA